MRRVFIKGEVAEYLIRKPSFEDEDLLTTVTITPAQAVAITSHPDIKTLEDLSGIYPTPPLFHKLELDRETGRTQQDRHLGKFSLVEFNNLTVSANELASFCHLHETFGPHLKKMLPLLEQLEKQLREAYLFHTYISK